MSDSLSTCRILSIHKDIAWNSKIETSYRNYFSCALFQEAVREVPPGSGIFFPAIAMINF
jgi:hypothetical protein